VTTPAINPRRLARLASIHLAEGKHVRPSEGMSAAEAASWLVGDWTDYPECVSQAIASLVRQWNDDLGDADRDRLLKPLVPIMVGTATSRADEVTRGWLAADWLLRVHAPAWLRLAGLTKHAARLAGLPELQGENYGAAAAPLEAARDAAQAAVARLDYPPDADVIVWDTASASAWTAVSAGANGFYGRDDVRSTAWLALDAGVLRCLERGTLRTVESTADELQTSACDLVRRLCEVGAG
jgi:hypothetical protein